MVDPRNLLALTVFGKLLAMGWAKWKEYSATQGKQVELECVLVRDPPVLLDAAVSVPCSGNLMEFMGNCNQTNSHVPQMTGHLFAAFAYCRLDGL